MNVKSNCRLLFAPSCHFEASLVAALAPAAAESPGPSAETAGPAGPERAERAQALRDDRGFAVEATPSAETLDAKRATPSEKAMSPA